MRDSLNYRRYHLSSRVDELEWNFRLLDQKNAELVAKNKQLATVREIAIGVDKVRTLDEALSLAVERARDIEGIRFVFVQKVDATGKFIITPYYSKIRNTYAARAIKALGFDVEKELGDSPANKNLLRFPSMKLKIAKDYLRNPRVMVMPSLAELLDGVWPKTLCDGIQKILGVKKIVIIPLMVEGDSWGNMLYFLDQEVPIDILEMIGAHCALAIKNIITLNSLELRNNELSALNRIANTTSKSLDADTLLNNTIDEIVHIYHADSVAIYLWNEEGQTLKLAVHRGMPEEIVRNSSSVPLKNYPMGTFFASGQNIITGNMEDSKAQFPDSTHIKTIQEPHQFVTSILHFGASRYGLVTLARAGTRQFEEREQSLLTSISNQLAVSLENSQLHSDVLRRMNEAEVARGNLRESEEKYRTIFESANDVMIVLDSKGKIVDVNARIKETTGYEREEIIGNNLKTISNMMFTSDSVAIVAKNYFQRMSGLTVSPYEVDMRTRDGQHKTVEINAVALRKDSQVIGDLAILRNITERKQAEMNLKRHKGLIDRILATIPNTVLLLNNNLQIIMANETFYNLFKLKKNDVENKHIQRIIVAPELDDAITKTLNSKEKKTSIEFRHTIASSQKVLLANIFAMEEDDLLLVINDVTEERQRQERLYLTDRLASVGEMASGVAHELNNPLTSIIGLSSLLTKQDMPDDMKEDLTAINSEAQRCAKIVKNLLTFARKHESKREPVQVAKIVEDVLQLRAYEHSAKNISIDNQFPPDLPDVPADYFQMQQVFLNIILNAEAAMIDAHSHGTLKITGEKVDGYIKVSFSDNGPGISKENMRLLFNPFFTTKEVGKGTGLGLSICYGIVTSHGGRIYAESEYGKGATFIVELPTKIVDGREF